MAAETYMRLLEMLRALLIIVLLSLACNTPAMDADSAVFDGSSFQLVQLSGNGRYVSYIDLTDDGTGELWRLDTGSPNKRVLVKKWSTSDLNYQMSADGRSFLLLHADGHGGSALTIIRLRERSGVEEQQVDIGSRIAGFGDTGVDAFQVLLQADNLSLSELSLAFDDGRVVRTNQLGQLRDVAYDGRGHIAALLSPAGSWKAVHSGDAGVGISSRHVDGPVIGAASDGRKIWFHTKDADGFDAITEASLLTGFVVPVTDGAHANVDVVTRDPLRGNLDAYLVDRFPRHWVALSATTANSLSFLRNQLKGEPIIVARSNNDLVWLVMTSGTSAPPTYYAYRRELGTGSVERLFVADHADKLSPSMPPLVTEVKSADGTLVQALASPPSRDRCDISATACPFIVKVHGGPHRHDGEEYNYRGSTGFGKAFALASNGEWGAGIIADIHAAIQWLVTLPGVDASRGAAVGASYGGFAAIALSTTYPGMLKCVESMNGGGDLEAFARYVPERRKDMAADLAEEVGDPNNPASLAKIREQSPLTRVSNAKSSFLIEYGAKDSTSAPEQSTGFVDALKTTSLPYVAVDYLDMPHEFRSVEQRQFHYSLMRRYLAQCLSSPETESEFKKPMNVTVSGQERLLRQLGLAN
jgi:dienelactone hydrolase